MGIVVEYDYVLKSKQTGRLSFRRTYPVELRPFVPAGHREMKVSLKGTSMSDAAVLQRYQDACAAYDATVLLAERRRSGAYDDLDEPTIAYLAKLFEHDWHVHEEREMAARGEEFVHQAREGWNWKLDEFRQWRLENDLDEMEEQWGGSARALLDHHGVLLAPEDGTSIRRLCKALNDTVIALSEPSKSRLFGGNIVPVPPLPEPPARKLEKTPLPLLATFDAYAAAAQVSPGIRVEWRAAMGRLVGFIGHDDAERLTTDDVMAWRDALLRETLKGGKLRTARTVRNKYLTPLRAMLKWAVQERKISTSVAEPVVVKVPKAARLRDKSFTTEEALAILSASLEPPEGRLSAPYALARRWVPWLCAYTGARVNEVGQLRKEDVREIEGIWTIRITPEAGRVKTNEARLVPLHAHIIEQGFLAVVAGSKDGHLFYSPSAKRGGEGPDQLFKKVGRRLADWVRDDVGITDPGIQPNHAWRHTFKTKAFTAGIQQRVMDEIQGHAPGTVSGTYGSIDLQTKAAAIASFPRFEVAKALSVSSDRQVPSDTTDQPTGGGYAEGKDEQ